ncbi:transmembrane protein 183 [Lutzomyia longipalpis]|uniref:transmembrane protein 183 n=1 Tax=Lutzomyia longipalpis TaxID=7200 RepID=UPI00248465A4|nr:transmembrane protein 183 [Lutzomyia longipalpis]
MSKKAKDKNKKYQAASDFSLNDCANAAVPGVRKKKPFGDCNNTKKLIQLAEGEKLEEGTSEEFDGEEVPENVAEVAAAVELPEEDFIDYSFDVWWLISEHIMPEDISRFSLICRKTATVVRMVKFWMHLYHRFYTPHIDLPAPLRPHKMAKQPNKRNAVIRTLFYTYSPFNLSVNRRAGRDPACLVGHRVASSWFVQQPGAKQQWIFIYTFKPRTGETNQRRKEANAQKKTNLEENSHVLLISTRQFRPLPHFHAHDVFLKALTRPLATGFSEFALRMEFEDYKRSIVHTITYDSGVSVQVIDWFSPLYETTVKKLCDFSACDDREGTFFAD